ncbi:MAG: hypothetical protein M3Q71_10690 [Chloroflexota bacterium]|nr:hypothetical protein [Chloroflexota bacterium]MDP9471115.1 hypothetical protein [Chloroflexota bacterium]
MAAPAREVHDPAWHSAEEGQREELRRNPDVVVRRRKTREPFVSAIRVARPVDVVDLIGRRDDDDVAADEEAPARRRA